jgi:predicted Zn finger-like uncharacterized protein
MSDHVSFRCDSCNTRLRVSLQLLGQTGRCPKCGHQMTARVRAPEPAGPAFVEDDSWVASRSALSWLD